MGELQLEMAIKQRPDPQSPSYCLQILQTPKDCRIAGKQDSEKPARASKWPLDPAPVVELDLHDNDTTRSWLHSPFWFCSAALEPDAASRGPMDSASNALTGCLVSSLHKVKLQDNIEHGIFIFGDLHAKAIGRFRLRFTLYEIRSNAGSTYVTTLTSTLSDAFQIHSGKTWPGQAESTPLSRHLCESGVKLRIRKETSKRKAQSQDWSSDKRTAITSLGLPSLMGPPPNHRIRRMTGDDITLDNVTYSTGLGLKNAIDREYSSTAGHLRSGLTGIGDPRSQSEMNPALTGPYMSQNIPAYSHQSATPYPPTQYANTHYLTGQSGYGNDATQYSRASGVPALLHPSHVSNTQEHTYPAPAYPATTTRYGGSHETGNISRSHLDRYVPLGPYQMYSGRAGPLDAASIYDQPRSDRAMLLTESTTASQSSWPPVPLVTPHPTTVPLE